MSNPAKLGNLDHGNFIRLPVGSTTVDLLQDDRIAQSVRGGKPFEPNTLKIFGDSVKPGTRVIDVGCYSGLFSIAATKLGAQATGFEPFPDNYRQIERNMRLNNAHFLLVDQALSDKNGDAELKFNPSVRLTSGASLERKSGPSMTIKTIRLDDYMKDFHFDDMAISVIKMDVERHEPAVIRGGIETIKRFMPLLIIEANDLQAREAVVKAMDGLGYGAPVEVDVRNLIYRPGRL